MDVPVCPDHQGLDPRRERPPGRVHHTDFGIEVTERESTLPPLGFRTVQKLRAAGEDGVRMEYAWFPLFEVVHGHGLFNWNVQSRVRAGQPPQLLGFGKRASACWNAACPAAPMRSTSRRLGRSGPAVMSTIWPCSCWRLLTITVRRRVVAGISLAWSLRLNLPFP